MKKINLKEHIKETDTVVLACSAGPDSMCLLNLLTTSFTNLKIICAHVNHNIREESFAEEKFIKEYCRKNKITYETTTLQTNDKREENLRKLRYKFLNEIIKKYNAKLLLTAHHGDDLIETILMRIARGSNLKGYSGFQEVSKYSNYLIYRPLISVTKDDIIEYNHSNNIPYVTDQSNFEDIYTRNRYRLNVLPHLKNERENVHEQYLKFSKEINEVNEFINEIVLKEFNNKYYQGNYNLDGFDKQNKYIQKKLIELYLHTLYEDDIYLINKKHINIIIDLINNKSNKSIDLPQMKITKEFNMLITKELSTKKEYNQELVDKIDIENFYFEILNDSKDGSNYITRINKDEVKMPLYIRNYNENDIINIKNMNGRKKIKDIFKNSKISKEKRQNYPVLTDSSGTILWLPGLKKSNFDKDITEKYDIIIKCIQKEMPKEKINE